jgi:hypothetical protein
MTARPLSLSALESGVDIIDGLERRALDPPGTPPARCRGQSFLRAHWGAIAGADFFPTEVRVTQMVTLSS